MRIDSAGRVTMPYQPAFDVDLQATATSSGVLLFSNVNTNVGGYYNPSTGRFTAPVTGVYMFYTGAIKANQTNVVRLAVEKNGARIGERHWRGDDNTAGAYGENGQGS